MGLPSSGIEYDVLSVRREMSVARSVPVVLSAGLVSTRDSVGAGRIGLRVSTPMVETGFLFPLVRQSHAPSGRMDDYDGTAEKKKRGVVGHSGDGYSVLVDTTVNSGGRRSPGGPRGRGRRGVREIGEERVGQRQGRRRRRRISKENRWEEAYQRRHLRTVGREEARVDERGKEEKQQNGVALFSGRFE